MDDARKTQCPVPPDEMIEFADRRLHEHIDRVRKNLKLMAKVTDYGEALIERANTHDDSKFSPEERLPYVWLAEYHRCKNNGEVFEYPPGVKALVSQAIDHHMTSNRHHHQYHNHPDDMTEVDLIEMVCDWTAMSQEMSQEMTQEFNQDDGSARGWAEKTLGKRVTFNETNTAFIYQMIDLLDEQVAGHAKRSFDR